MKLLTTLALIKTNLDHKNESILDSYIPFVKYYLAKTGCKNIDTHNLRASLLDEFGFPVPSPALNLMLEKMCRNNELAKTTNGSYSVNQIDFDTNLFDEYRASASAGIEVLIRDFQNYALEANGIMIEKTDAEIAINSFMDSNTINCISAFVHQKEIEVSKEYSHHNQFSIASYAESIRLSDPEKFKIFIVLIIGRLGANLLNGAATIDSSAKLIDTFIIFDTPWLIKMCGYVGKEQQAVAKELLDMCKSLGSKTVTFTHLRSELDNILYNVERMLSGSFVIPPRNGHKDTDVYSYCRTNKISKSDVTLWRSQLDDYLKDAAIDVLDAPTIIPEYNISSEELSQIITDTGLIYNEDSKKTDIESIRAIYQIRAGVSPTTLEKSIATLCTTNEKLARAAFKYGKLKESNFEVSSVVTDFSLCNLLWFKFPSQLSELPEKILMANCAAAIMPTVEYIQKLDSALIKILESKKITEEAYQNFRYNTSARDHLLNLTKGDPDELTEDQIQLVISSYDERITKPHVEKIGLLTEKVETLERISTEETGRLVGYMAKAEKAEATVDKITTNLAKYIASFINWGAFAISVSVFTLTLIGKINSGFGYPAAAVVFVYSIFNETAKRAGFNRVNVSRKIADRIVAAMKQ